MRCLEAAQDVYMTLHRRPRSPASTRTRALFPPPAERQAIVVQGPLVEQHSLTLQALALYRRHFPEALVVFSTWDGLDKQHADAIEKAGVHLTTQPRPIIAGPQNINLQLASTVRGLELARSLGARFAVKTRSDQIIYSPDALTALHSLCVAFPLGPDTGGQKHRLVGCSLNTFIYRMYGMGDMLLYGDIEDMLAYWGAPHDTRPIEPSPPRDTFRTFCRRRICEVYLMTEFLTRVGRPVRWTLDDSLDAIARHFCVIDQETLDVYWPKYAPRAEHRYREYQFSSTGRTVTFSDWLALHQGARLGAAFEAVLDLEHATELPPEPLLHRG